MLPGQVSSGGVLAAQKSPAELLAPLESLCLYRIEDWWTYELCYGRRHALSSPLACAATAPSRGHSARHLICSWRSVRQFHKEGDALVSEFNLGTYRPERSALDDVREDDSPGAATPAAYVMQATSFLHLPCPAWLPGHLMACRVVCYRQLQ